MAVRPAVTFLKFLLQMQNNDFQAQSWVSERVTMAWSGIWRICWLGMVRIWFLTIGATLQGKCDKEHFAKMPPSQIFFQYALNWSMWNANFIFYMFNHHMEIQYHNCANFWPLFIDGDGLPVHSLSSSDPWPFLNWYSGHTQKNFHEL